MSTISSSGRTIYIQYESSTYQYQINSTSGSWTTISSWPVTINNTSGSSLLTVSIYNEITFTTSSQYFICGSNNITFDGVLNTIIIESVILYPGFIQNGTSSISGYNNITCQNFYISSRSSSLNTNNGWLCQSYFNNGSTGGRIINSYSNGPIPLGCGGIIGAYSGSNSGTYTISKCFSLGNFIFGGGIVGNFTADNGGIVFIINCYSNGSIASDGGGILGGNSGIGGTINISNCYSLGNINGGGIVGGSSGSGGGTVSVSNCYSRGPIAVGCGGIVASLYGNVICTHCYTFGLSSVSNQNGIYAGSSSDNPLGSNNYSEANNGTSGWNNTNATTYLLNGPVGYVQGSVWTDFNFTFSTSIWVLSVFNNNVYSPNIATVSENIVYTTSDTILSGITNQIISVNNSPTYSDISIDSSTGALTFTNKPGGTYEVLVWNFKSNVGLPYNYNINTFTLTVSSGPTPGSSTMNYYSSRNGALNQNSSKLLGSSSSSYQIGKIDSGSLVDITLWRIASNSTGSSLKKYTYTNDVILNNKSSPTYYLYPARFKKSLRAKRVLNQSFKIVPVWNGYQYYMKKANRLGFSRIFYSTYLEKYNKNH